MIIRKEDAVFDGYQEKVFGMLEDMFPNINLTATSGHRAPLDQLHLIGAFATQHHITYPEFDPQDATGRVLVDDNGVITDRYKWQRTWSECLRQGIVINPPIAERAMYDYISADGTNKKGMLIPTSTHIVPTFPGLYPMDFSQKIDGLAQIDRVAQIMQQAQASGIPIRKITIEHGNGCVHIEINSPVVKG